MFPTALPDWWLDQLLNIHSRIPVMVYTDFLTLRVEQGGSGLGWKSAVAPQNTNPNFSATTLFHCWEYSQKFPQNIHGCL